MSGGLGASRNVAPTGKNCSSAWRSGGVAEWRASRDALYSAPAQPARADLQLPAELETSLLVSVRYIVSLATHSRTPIHGESNGQADLEKSVLL